MLLLSSQKSVKKQLNSEEWLQKLSLKALHGLLVLWVVFYDQIKPASPSNSLKNQALDFPRVLWVFEINKTIFKVGTNVHVSRFLLKQPFTFSSRMLFRPAPSLS